MITIRRRIFARRLSTMANPELRFDKQTAGTSDEFHVNIGNYQIHFPYVPYACQREYMEKVLFSLESGTNAALESPTGTGKTLSLLCPTIEWFLQQKKSAKLQGIPTPKIYYSSRTHHQLKQVIKELNKTKYRNLVKVATLASRDHLCLNQHVLKAANKGEMCQTKIRENMCQFYKNFQEIFRNKDKFEDVYFANNLDLNGVKELARQNGHCPFYAAREMSKSADLIFLPYNYLVEPEIREHFSIDLKGNILIFDEAHNLESMAEKSMSISFSTGILRKAINELWEAIKLKEKLLNRNIDGGLRDLDEDRQLYKRLNELERQIKCIDLERDGVGMHAISGLNQMDGRVFGADKMVELLRAAGIEYEDRHKIRALINHICAFLAVQIERSRRWEYKGGFKIPIPRGIGLTHFNLLLSRIFIDMENTKALSLNNHFKLFAHERWTGENEKEIMLHLWCFDAGVAMRYLESRGTRSIVLASGT